MKTVFFIPFIFLFFSSCSVLNSGTANVKFSVAEATFDNIKYKNKNRLSDISASVRNVQHPKPYGEWAINLKISPSIHFDRFTFEQDQIVRDSLGNSITLPEIKIDRFSGMGNLKLTTHTPIGAFALSGGFGGTLFRQRDGLGLNTLRTGEISKVELVWVGFFSERFFVLMGPRYFKESYDSVVFAIRLGYFWGDMTKSDNLFGF